MENTSLKKFHFHPNPLNIKKYINKRIKEINLSQSLRCLSAPLRNNPFELRGRNKKEIVNQEENKCNGIKNNDFKFYCCLNG